MSEQKVHFADALRGPAALCVLVSHYFAAFWALGGILPAYIGGPAIAENQPVPVIARAIIGSRVLEPGPYGVALFFLISGFAIPFAIARYSRRGFLIARALRILPTYAAGFAVTFGSLAALTMWYATPMPASPAQIAIHFVAGLRLLTSSKPIDLVVWTLEAELVFYAVCCLAAPLIRRASVWLFAIPIVVAAFDVAFGRLVSASGVPLAIALLSYLHFTIFMFIGVAIHYAYVGKLQLKQAVVLIGALGITYAGSSFFGVERYPHLLTSYGLAFVTFAGAWAFAERIPRWRILRFFADISFPLYACHPILGYATLRVLLDLGLAGTTAAVCLAVVACGISYAIHTLVEDPTHRLGQRLVRRRWRKAQCESEPKTSTAMTGSPTDTPLRRPATA